MALFNFVNVGAVGTTVTSGASSANVAIPNDGSGARAKAVRITATALAHVKLINGTGTAATANDLMVGPGDGINLYCKNYDHVAYIQETAAAKINIAPLEC